MLAWSMALNAYPPVLWHASRSAVDRPTLEGRIAGDNHANSGLGLWCATAPHGYLSGFGSTVHALTLASDLRVLTLPLSEVAAMGRHGQGSPAEDRAWFEAHGRRLAETYELLVILEHNGFSSQAIVLKDEAIADSMAMPVALFKRLSSDVQDHMRAFEKRESQAQDRCRHASPSREDLERMDIDALDRLAFGVADGDQVTLKPEAIQLPYPGDLLNPMARFDKEGMDWVQSVDFSEPVEVSVNQAGEFCLENGHHRWFAARMLGRTLEAVVAVKGKPIERILEQGARRERALAQDFPRRRRAP